MANPTALDFDWDRCKLRIVMRFSLTRMRIWVGRALFWFIRAALADNVVVAQKGTDEAAAKRRRIALNRQIEAIFSTTQAQISP
jgi:hypothetical protein